MRAAEDRRQLGPDVRFSHLDDIADPAPAEDGGSSLRVLRSSHEIARVARDLHNCARRYIGRVQKRGYVLVALFKGDKAVALAGHAGGPEWDHRPVAANNRTASAEVGARFDAFLPMLRQRAAPPAPTCGRCPH